MNFSANLRISIFPYLSIFPAQSVCLSAGLYQSLYLSVCSYLSIYLFSYLSVNYSLNLIDFHSFISNFLVFSFLWGVFSTVLCFFSNFFPGPFSIFFFHFPHSTVHSFFINLPTHINRNEITKIRTVERYAVMWIEKLREVHRCPIYERRERLARNTPRKKKNKFHSFK